MWKLIVFKTEDVQSGVCNFRGSCKFENDCKKRCGPPEFPDDTIGLCMANPLGTGDLCCCSFG